MTPAGAGVHLSRARDGAVLSRERQRIGAVWVVLAVTLALYWPTVASLLPQWGDFGNLTYAHGYLVAALAGWMLWRRRHALGSDPFRPNWLASVGVALAGLAWLVLLRSGIQLAHQLLLPVIAWFAILSVCGGRAALQCLSPLSYVYFAIPVWDLVNGVLQAATVVAARVSLQTVGVPAYFEGNFVHIPAGTFEIAGGCSGLHFFIVALAIAALYGELHRDTWRVRTGLLLLAGATAVLANGIRVFSIIVAGHLTDMQHYLVRVDHYYFGWGVFAVAMIFFFLLARKLPLDADPSVGSAGLESQGGSAEARQPRWATAAAALALLIAPVWSAATAAGNSGGTLSVEVLPIPGWTGPVLRQGSWRPRFESADIELGGEVRSGSAALDLYVAGYANQSQDKELTGYGNSIAGRGYREGAKVVRNLSDGNSVNELVLVDGNGGESLVWYAYIVDGRVFTSGTKAQLRYGVASLASAPESLVIAIRAACSTSCEAATSDLVRFASDSGLLAGRGLRTRLVAAGS